MASTNFKNFKSIDDRFERALFVVAGYTHENDQEEFLLDLIKIITAYYVQSDEWYSKHMGNCLKILKQTRLVQTQNKCHGCAFGTEEISNGKYEWKIRVNKYNYAIKGYWHIYVGVIDTNLADMEKRATNAPEFEGCYSFDVTKGYVVNQRNRSTEFKHKVTNVGDIIEIELDLDNKKVCCKINDKDIGKSIKIETKDGKYRLLASMYFDKNELELL